MGSGVRRVCSTFEGLEERGEYMKRHATRRAVALTGVLATILTTTLPLQSAFGEGGARRDVVRQEQQNVKDAIKHATEAVDHGKQGMLRSL